MGGANDGNLGTIALLGGLGGGYGPPSGYYPSYGAPAAALAQGKKRRGLDVECCDLEYEKSLEDEPRCPRGPGGIRYH